VDGNGGLKEQISRLIEGNAVVFIDPSARVAKSVMIEGPCYIGPDAEIRHGAYLRGGSWICKGALVGNSSEIKNSILLPGAKAPHFNYVGDSIVGANTNLGAGVKLSNVRNDRGLVSITLFDGKRIETKLNKMGALIGDGSQIGCNTVTNPGSLIAPNSMVNPNETVTGCFGTMS
jgi:NDP-sugar pyrophosphorylase family protein